MRVVMDADGTAPRAIGRYFPTLDRAPSLE
jgi:hypothetical protein